MSIPNIEHRIPNHKFNNEVVSWDPKDEPVIGLEIHVELLTASKTFCSCSTNFGAEPNSNVCPVCLGMPGVLPVLNLNHVEFVLRMGLATHCTIAARSIFARKNYFYPDLPKGYRSLGPKNRSAPEGTLRSSPKMGCAEGLVSPVSIWKKTRENRSTTRTSRR